MNWQVLNGDSLKVLAGLPDNSIDAVVTDPPYGLSVHKPHHIAAAVGAWLAGESYRHTAKGFMGAAWDSFVPGPELWREVLRVLKPGGHACVFAGTRTADLMGLALRLAGFEIRDSLSWMFGSGFPKSASISKAIDKAAGAEPIDGGPSPNWREGKRDNGQSMGAMPNESRLTFPATEGAKKWEGWGTNLKPAYEPILLARKPVEGTIAANVQKHGTGAINIDATRIEMAPDDFEKLNASVEATRAKGGVRGDSWKNSSDLSGANPASELGRWPANLIMDEEAGALLDAQAGDRPGNANQSLNPTGDGLGAIWGGAERTFEGMGRGDSGGPSRFFYCPKTSKQEKNLGLHHLPVKSGGEATGRADGSAGTQSPRAGAGRTGGNRNPHPTTKPIALMDWLCRLVTPPGGLILDPFTGSGSTGCAAVLAGFRFYGIELSPEFTEVARARIDYFAQGGPLKFDPPPKVDPRQAELFGGGE